MYLIKTIEISKDIRTELLQSLKINQPPRGYTSGELSLAMEIYFKKHGTVSMKFVGRGLSKLVDPTQCFIRLRMSSFDDKVSLYDIKTQLLRDDELLIDKIQQKDKYGVKLYHDNDKTMPQLRNFYKVK